MWCWCWCVLVLPPLLLACRDDALSAEGLLAVNGQACCCRDLSGNPGVSGKRVLYAGGPWWQQIISHLVCSVVHPHQAHSVWGVVEKQHVGFMGAVLGAQLAQNRVTEGCGCGAASASVAVACVAVGVAVAVARVGVAVGVAAAVDNRPLHQIPWFCGPASVHLHHRDLMLCQLPPVVWQLQQTRCKRRRGGRRLCHGVGWGGPCVEPNHALSH